MDAPSTARSTPSLRRLLRSLALAIVALGLAGAGAAGITASAHSADAVTNAAPTTSNPSVVQLEFYRISDGADVGLCSGLSLTRHWIMTSAHCLKGRSLTTYQVEVRRTTPTGATEVVYPRGVAGFTNHPDYDEAFGTIDRGNDVGLVRLLGAGLSTFAPARIYDGFIRGDGWKGRHDRVMVAGYGRTNLPGSNDCGPAGTSGTKRFGWIHLTGSTFDAGAFGTGQPLAVQGDEDDQKLCHGDSGGAWSFDGPVGPLAFALHSGPGARFHNLTDPWATLIRPKLGWAVAKGSEKGVPFACRQQTQFALTFITCAEPTPPRPPVVDPAPGLASGDTDDPSRLPSVPGADRIAREAPAAGGPPDDAGLR